MNLQPSEIANLFFTMTDGLLQEEKIIRLARLIELSFHSGVSTALERAKKEYRIHHSGGCRMLYETSVGELCSCFLCSLDKLK